VQRCVGQRYLRLLANLPKELSPNFGIGLRSVGKNLTIIVLKTATAIFAGAA
jgi:hypothetical protein